MTISVKKLTIALMIAATMFVTYACAHVGRRFDTTHAREVQRGQPRALVLEWFGEPPSVTVFSMNAQGCVERWQYTHAVARRRHTHAEVLIVDFDAGGLVCDTAFTELDQ